VLEDSLLSQRTNDPKSNEILGAFQKIKKRYVILWAFEK
jgi:hypothetical protein